MRTQLTTYPSPLSISPLKGEQNIFTLPFKGRARVGMGRSIQTMYR